MFCEVCGFEVEERDLFCRSCGLDFGPSGQSRQVPRCTRVRKGRVVAGICGGWAAHFDKDVRIVRVLWLAAAAIPPVFPGVAAYLVCWLLMPPPVQEARAEAAASD